MRDCVVGRLVGAVGDGAEGWVACGEFALGVLAVVEEELVGLRGVAEVSVGGVFFGYVGAQEGDQQGRWGVGFSRAFEGRDLEAVGEAEVGDLESVGEAECVEVFPRLCGGDGDAGQVRGVGDGTGPGVRLEV